MNSNPLNRSIATGCSLGTGVSRSNSFQYPYCQVEIFKDLYVFIYTISRRKQMHKTTVNWVSVIHMIVRDPRLRVVQEDDNSSAVL